jgi:hypothetical protein
LCEHEVNNRPKARIGNDFLFIGGGLIPVYQVSAPPQAWKGRLYSDRRTGFDGICWYATVRDGHLLAYSLGVSRGNDFWLLEIGNPSTIRMPPQVSPDPNSDWFVGHRYASEDPIRSLRSPGFAGK